MEEGEEDDMKQDVGGRGGCCQEDFELAWMVASNAYLKGVRGTNPWDEFFGRAEVVKPELKTVCIKDYGNDADTPF